MEFTNNNNVNERNFIARLIARVNNKNILPITTSNDSIRCHDFDFNKSNCLWHSKIEQKKIQFPVIYPYNESIDSYAITIHDKPIPSNNDVNYKICDMV